MGNFQKLLLTEKVTIMEQLQSSFRDPSGYLFTQDATLYRFINPEYIPNYNHLMASGLYQKLSSENKLIKHSQESLAYSEGFTIKPHIIPIVSYPYEWSFSQLKDAALLTLSIQKDALEYGMILKDATAFNVQFVDASPIFIDTLSFELLDEKQPWVAYRQFCQHFLTPLALMAHVDVRLLSLFETYLDGIPLDLTSILLPFSTRFNFSLLLHIHMHAKSQKKFERSQTSHTHNQAAFSLTKHKSLIDSLITSINNLALPKITTEWGDYYNDDSYTTTGLASKQTIVSQFLNFIKPDTVCDLGANDGFFSLLAKQHAKRVISTDYDPLCVEKNYLRLKSKQSSGILPLMINITNTSPALGWNHAERTAFEDRVQADCSLALALIHHLAISNNIPLTFLAQYFSTLSQYLIVEFIPKTDKKVQTLLATRKDVFTMYNKETFEKIFAEKFHILEKVTIDDSERTLYLMKRLK